jgi:glycosyltransferase involved in cell wall biosynthesis
MARNVPGKKLRKTSKAAEYLVNMLGLHWNIWIESPDVVHYQWLPFAKWFPSIEELNISRSKKDGASVIYTVHNVLPHDTGDRYKNIFRRIYRIPDALICHTEESRNRLVEDFDVPSGKIWVIPHGPLSDEVIPVPRVKARTQLGIDLETPVCLLFGFMRPYKGIEFLLDSWVRVREREPSARLMLVGQPEREYEEVLLEKIERLGLEREVITHFAFLPQEELNLHIHAADVLVYPYRNITQSGALLTGLTTGKPVVATSVGGFREMIQHEQTGILVEHGDEEQLAEELVRLLRDAEKRAQLGQAAQEMAETEYSWDAIARKTLECYRSVID